MEKKLLNMFMGKDTQSSYKYLSEEKTGELIAAGWLPAGFSGTLGVNEMTNMLPSSIIVRESFGDGNKKHGVPFDLRIRKHMSWEWESDSLEQDKGMWIIEYVNANVNTLFEVGSTSLILTSFFAILKIANDITELFENIADQKGKIVPGWKMEGIELVFSRHTGEPETITMSTDSERGLWSLSLFGEDSTLTEKKNG